MVFGTNSILVIVKAGHLPRVDSDVSNAITMLLSEVLMFRKCISKLGFFLLFDEKQGIKN